MAKRIFITGTGIVTSLGFGTTAQWHALRAARSGIGQIDFFESIHKGVLPVCEIKKTNEELAAKANIPLSMGYSRTAIIGILATQEALQSAGITDLKSQRTGLISSTTVGGMREFESLFYELQDAATYPPLRAFGHITDAGEHTERIADFFGFKDFVNTISTACSSSSNAIIIGAEMIKHGLLDRVVCGGSDVLSKFTVNGFNSLMILDKQHSRPFDATRAGLQLGEGAAYVVLEGESVLQNSSQKIYGELTGYSNSNDAFHQTASSPDGDGAKLSMSRAIEMAGLQPSDINYINCHGTGTENNDLSEALAMRNLFGKHVPPFSSTKPYTGHTLAAAGAVEAVFSLLAIEHGALFPNLNFTQPMPEINLHPITTFRDNVPVQHVLSNSFGFGGSNTSLLLSKVTRV